MGMVIARLQAQTDSRRHGLADMDSSTFPRLVGDVGGTNARFAWQATAGAALSDVTTLPCADFPALQDAMQHYLAGHGRGAARWCAIGIANPVVGDQVRMTNHHWSFSIEAVRQLLGLERFLVINDFTALALSLPALAPDEVRQVGLELGGHGDRLLAIARLADDVVAGLGQHLGEVQTDDRLILGDQDPPLGGNANSRGSTWMSRRATRRGRAQN